MSKYTVYQNIWTNLLCDGQFVFCGGWVVKEEELAFCVDVDEVGHVSQELSNGVWKAAHCVSWGSLTIAVVQKIDQ